MCSYASEQHRGYSVLSRPVLAYTSQDQPTNEIGRFRRTRLQRSARMSRDLGLGMSCRGPRRTFVEDGE